MKIFLQAVADLHSQVNVKAIVIALVDRLSGYASRGNVKLQGKDGDLFSVFSEQLSKIIEGRESLALEHVLGMQASLLQLALTCYKDERSYVDKILEATADIVGQNLSRNNLKVISRNFKKSRKGLINFLNFFVFFKYHNN